jgi:hypothetical protein
LREEKYKKHAPVIEPIRAKYKEWRIHRTTEDRTATRPTRWPRTLIDDCVIQASGIARSNRASAKHHSVIARIKTAWAISANIEGYRC